MLKTIGETFDKKTVAISGSGNVAQFAAEKAIEIGAKVVTLSDSSGFVFDREGLTTEKLEFVKELKNVKRGRIKEYADHFGLDFFENARPWQIKVDIALPCATQNELDQADAKKLIENGVLCIAEGANMPCTPEAVKEFHSQKILYAPGKASNAGGVATSGMEMTQNSMRYNWTREEVDKRLKDIMVNIHATCVKYGNENGYIDYVKGANIGGFIKVAEAMLAQGVV
jgi:glutamate dehydrogenase (NADP+)